MDELGTTPEVTPATSEETYINPDGTYKEGWKDALLPEELRTEKFYDSPFNANIKELLKTAGNQAKMLGKKGVIPLSEKSTETEVKEWRKAHGVPEQYKYQTEEEDFISKNLESINKLNLSQGQLDVIAKLYHEDAKKTEEEFKNEIKQKQQQTNQNMLIAEGVNYETIQANVDKIVRLGTEGWPQEDILKLFPTKDTEGEFLENLEDNYFDRKLLQRKFLATIGSMIGEHRMVQGEIGGKSLQQQLDEVRNSEAYRTGVGKVHNDATAKAIELQKQINAQMGR